MRDNVENLRMDVLRVHMFADTNAARLSSTDYVAIKQVASALGDVLAGTEQVSEKCATESIALLRKYNQWRCGVIDSFDGNEGPNPRAITEAINSVCADTEALRARVSELEASENIREASIAVMNAGLSLAMKQRDEAVARVAELEAAIEGAPVFAYAHMNIENKPHFVFSGEYVALPEGPTTIELIARPTVEVRRG